MKLLLVNQDRMAMEIEGTLTTEEFEQIRLPKNWHFVNLFMSHLGTTSFVDKLVVVYHEDHNRVLWPEPKTEGPSEFDIL